MSRRSNSWMLLLAVTLVQFGCEADVPATNSDKTTAKQDSKPNRTSNSPTTVDTPKEKSERPVESKKSPKDLTHKLALLVGCTKYESAPSLQGPINDVRLMSELLSARFKFPPRNIRKLVGWPDDKRDRPIHSFRTG